jgi:uncharacterized membrane protein (DUF2068 family)
MARSAFFAVVIPCDWYLPASMRPSANKTDEHPVQRRALRAIALFELIKGIFVLLIGLCALALVHKDLWLLAESLLALLHINTDRRSAQMFLDFADNVTDARLWAAARIAFGYSALRFTEAYGLWGERQWAEWVACVSGTLFLPVEIRQLARGITLVRSLLFLGNLAIVVYMGYLLRASHRQRRGVALASKSTGDASPMESNDSGI